MYCSHRCHPFISIFLGLVLPDRWQKHCICPGLIWHYKNLFIFYIRVSGHFDPTMKCQFLSLCLINALKENADKIQYIPLLTCLWHFDLMMKCQFFLAGKQGNSISRFNIFMSTKWSRLSFTSHIHKKKQFCPLCISVVFR